MRGAKDESFGARMAREKREEFERYQRRLDGAKKRTEEKHTWNNSAEDLIWIVRCQEQLGYKTQVKYNKDTGKLDVIAYKEVWA